MLTKQDIQQLKKIFLTKEEFEEKLEKKLEEKLEEKLANFPTKDVVYTMLDEIYKAVTSNSDEIASMRFRLQDHEKRISLLEKVTSSLATT